MTSTARRLKLSCSSVIEACHEDGPAIYVQVADVKRTEAIDRLDPFGSALVGPPENDLPT
jgi:hypothetical protein